MHGRRTMQIQPLGCRKVLLADITDPRPRGVVIPPGRMHAGAAALTEVVVVAVDDVFAGLVASLRIKI